MKITSNFNQRKTSGGIKAVSYVFVFFLMYFVSLHLCATNFNVRSANTLYAAIACAKAGDTINVRANEITLNATITLRRGIKIVGLAVPPRIATINMKTCVKKGIFITNIPADQTLQLSDLTIQGGNTLKNGGGIYNIGKGKVVLKNCKLKNNKAHKNGGAIYNGAKGRINIFNSHVNANTASYGGGICNDGSLEVTGIFSAEKNYTKSCSGGAIFNQGTIEFTSGIFNFSENYTGNGGGNGENGGSGGAIYNNGEIVFTDVAKCTIAGNYTGKGGGVFGGNGGSGGAIYNKGKIMFSDVAKCDIAGNYTGNGAYEHGGHGGSGGAIYNNGKIMFNDVAKCDIAGNYTGIGGGGGHGGSGGAIFLRGNIIVDNNTTLNINDNYVPGNIARGGGIWISKSSIFSGDILSKKINISNNYRRGPSGEIENVFREGCKKELTSGLSNLEIIKSSEL